MAGTVPDAVVRERRSTLLHASVLLVPLVLIGIFRMKEGETRMTDTCRTGGFSVPGDDGTTTWVEGIDVPCRPETRDVPASWRAPAAGVIGGSLVVGIATAWAAMPWLSDLDRRTRQRRSQRVRIRPMLGFRLAGWGAAILGGVVAVGVGTDPEVHSTLLRAGCVALGVASVVLALQMGRWGVVAGPSGLTEHRLVGGRRIAWSATSGISVQRTTGSRVFGGVGISLERDAGPIVLRSVWRWDTDWSELLLRRWSEQLGALRAACASASAASGP